MEEGNKENISLQEAYQFGYIKATYDQNIKQLKEWNKKIKQKLIFISMMTLLTCVNIGFAVAQIIKYTHLPICQERAHE
jgi:hypothetical protein